MTFRKIPPGPGQESVWDFPRPPKVELRPDDHVRLVVGGFQFVDTRRACRVLETSHPPVYYVPVADIEFVSLLESEHRTFCEFKGEAVYVSLVLPDRTIIANAGWFYPKPASGFELLDRMLGFYPSKLEACFVNDEAVTAQEGDFYGGWITSSIVGPFKGGPGTRGW